MRLLIAQTYRGGVDWAGVLYACSVGSTGNVKPNSQNVTLRGAKVRSRLRSAKLTVQQYWYFLSTSGQQNGPSPY